jgi:prepilin-type processing-associated H-X9-DG protein/prepilin-type N-terminal cleavage/methylation domain-containing protein
MIRYADIPPRKSRGSNLGFTLIEVIVVILVITVLAGLMYPLVRGVMEKARTAKCQAHMRQLAVGCLSFNADNGGGLPPLYTWQELFPEIAETRDKIATGAGVVAWPDLIRQHVGNDDAFSCPSLTTNATIGYGGIYSSTHPLGIGINFDTIASIWKTPGEFQKMSRVDNPSKVVLFVDAGGGEFSTGNFKNRKDTPGCGSALIRGNSVTGEQVMPRHGGKANVVFMDGHVQLVNPQEIDWGRRTPSAPAIGWADATWK